MPTLRARRTDPDLTLAGLEIWINDRQIALGPIVAIGSTETETAAAFSSTDAPVDPITLLIKGTPAPDGKAIACKGIVFIQNVLRQVEVWR